MKSQDPVCEVECCHNKDGLSSHITERLPEGTPLYLAPQPTPQEVEDARRYRALAANLSSTEFCEHLWTSCNDVPTKEQLDAAIDAAIAKEES